MRGNAARLLSSVAGIGLGLSVVTTTQATAAEGGRCTLRRQTISASDRFVPLSDLRVAGGGADVLVRLSADIGVDPGAEVRIAYSIDGGPPRIFGPTNFANHQEFSETRTTIAVIPDFPSAPRLITVTPLWRVSGAPGKQATVVNACMTVQAIKFRL